jgi:hypothetical protein
MNKNRFNLVLNCRNKRYIRRPLGRLALLLARRSPLRGCSSLAPRQPSKLPSDCIAYFCNQALARKWVMAFGLGILCALRTDGEAFVEVTVKIEMDDWSFNFLQDQRRFDSNSSLAAVGRSDSSRTLRCVIGSNSWVIEAEPGNLVENVKETIWFTGTNIIQHDMLVVGMTRQVNPQPGTAVGTFPAGGERWTRVWESTDGNPGRPVNQADVLQTAAKTCWLAFCSGSFLKHDGRKIPLPDDLWKEYLSAPNGFSDLTTVFKDDLGLPKSIKLFAETNQAILEYQVHRSTNMLGWNIPLEFYLIQYNRAGTNGWEALFTAKGQVTAIGPGKKIEVPPDIFQYRQN